MRKLAFLVHPDRFSAAPHAAEENQESLSVLQGLLSTVQKSKDSHPKAGIQRLRFHVHDGDRTRVVEQVLKTTGGDCRLVVERSLAELFTKLGLPPSFRWGAGDWSVLSESERAARDNRGGAEETVSEQPPAQPLPPAFDAQAVAPRRAPPGDARDLAEALAAMDPLLHAVAAVPWLPSSPEGAARRHYLIHDVVGSLEAEGWNISRGVGKIWTGARDSDALMAEEDSAGVDAASLQALKAVLFHAHRLEQELGPPAV